MELIAFSVQAIVLLHKRGDGEGWNSGKCSGTGGRVSGAGHEFRGGRSTSGLHGRRWAAICEQQGTQSPEVVFVLVVVYLRIL